MKKIRDWLQGGTFVEGVELFRKSGGTVPPTYFDRYCSLPYVHEGAMERLRHELASYLARHEHPVESTEEKEERRPMPRHRQARADDEPKSIAELRRRGRELLKRQAFLHARLGAAATDEERYKIARELMEKVIRKIDSVYSQIREWEATGSIPDMPRDEVVQQTVEKMLLVQTLRSKVSRRKKAVAGNLSPLEQQQIEKEILQLQDQLEQLEDELGLNT